MTYLLTNVAYEVGKAIDAPTSAKDGITDKFSNLVPSVPMMIATILAFAIVFAILTWLLYKPVKKMMKKRADFVQGNIDDSIKEKELSQKAKLEANDKLQDAHKQADIIITKAKIKASEVSRSYTEKAKAESKRLLEETSQDIASQKRQFDSNAKQYIVTVATDLAEKILKREITPETQTEIIDQFLNSNKTPEEL
ncbi:F0F1 ATP synthase subunit B [Mycoplasmopsis verecunda]|uniref:ATP synthase subunit b n=1 Tax=Mycoplasmopsis verecunda TaxID=171291 RepID=A0A1T4KKM7_9BACT|nr:F0F1 ATP synthase subunit B [Mycoplasmopsis verecunda]WPB54267.1 F0F1 ATP synthase subunit B [Mycoplasmopsis verecunda]SJZ42954.1 F-type H+-transporting ATPase subunit b [Mycoplasmopsis verecunda]